MHIINNKRLFRFELSQDGSDPATLEYRWLKGSMVLIHTVVPPSLRGKGMGTELVKYVLEYAKANNLKIIVYCAFVEKYMSMHPEHETLRDETRGR